MLLRTIGLSLIATHLVVCGAAADDQAELNGQMELFRKAATERDATTMDRLLSDDYLLITRIGLTNTKKQYLDRIRQGTTPGGGKYQLVQTRVYGNTGIVTEKVNVSTPQGGRQDTIQTSVWVKDQGRWKLVSRQVTDVTDMPSSGAR